MYKKSLESEIREEMTPFIEMLEAEQNEED